MPLVPTAPRADPAPRARRLCCCSFLSLSSSATLGDFMMSATTPDTRGMDGSAVEVRSTRRTSRLARFRNLIENETDSDVRGIATGSSADAPERPLALPLMREDRTVLLDRRTRATGSSGSGVDAASVIVQSVARPRFTLFEQRSIAPTRLLQDDPARSSILINLDRQTVNQLPTNYAMYPRAFQSDHQPTKWM